MEEVRFRTIDDTVVLVDVNGVQRYDAKAKPIQAKIKHGENAKGAAYQLGKDHQPQTRGDFNRKILYRNAGKL